MINAIINTRFGNTSRDLPYGDVSTRVTEFFVYSDALTVIENEGIKLQEAAMLENKEENEKAAKELEKKMAKELAKAKKAK